jgi:hypothetical protein
MAMPFLAQGGSSLVTNWVIVALLVRLSDRARRDAAEREDDLARPPGGEPAAAGAGPAASSHDGTAAS